MSKDGLSAAELIRRFKEGKPTSREDRERQRQSVGQSRMWWENEDSGNARSGNDNAPPTRSITPTSSNRPASRISKPDPELETLEEPRRPYLKPPMVQPSRRDVSDSQDLFRSSANLGNSMDVDYLIEKEIRNLEKDIKKKERETMQRLNMGSFTPQKGLNRSMENGLTVGTSIPSPHVRYRPTLRDQGGLSGGGNLGGSLQDTMLSRSGEMFRGSLDTLGSTGMLGLLRADLKLDGKKDPKDEEKKVDDTKSENVHLDLDALMKNLREFLPEDKPSYLPDGVEETIPQITNRLHCQMVEFMSIYNGAILKEKEREEEQKKRDEEMKEEGRRLEREKRIMEMEIPPFQHPLDYMQPPDVNTGQSKLGELLRPDGTPDNANGDDHTHGKVPPFADDYRRWRGIPGDARFVNRLMDFELNQVDATYGRMRQVRQQLASQVHHLNHIARDPQRYAYEQQQTGKKGSGRSMKPEEEVDDGYGGYHQRPPNNSSNYNEDGYLTDDPDFDPVRMQHDPQYRDYVLQRRSRRRNAWNPYPELLPENIFNTSKAIESALNSAMDTLNRRLPEKRLPIPTSTSAVSPRPATPMPSAAQRDAALTPVPGQQPSAVRSSTPMPSTPTSVSSQNSGNSQQSVTTATNTALNSGRSPAAATTPAIPTTSTAPNTAMVKPIATNPTTTTSVLAATATAKPAVNAASASTANAGKPLPDLKTDNSGHIERLVDSLVASAKDKVASGGTAPGVPKLDASGTSLDLSRDSNNSQILSAASSISLSSSHERLIPSSVAAPTSSTLAPPATAAPVNNVPNSGLRASMSTPVPTTRAPNTPLPTTAPAPSYQTPTIAPIQSTNTSGLWTQAQWDVMQRDLEYVDNVLNQVDRAPGRFDKYTQPNTAHRPPPIAPTPAPASTLNKTVTFASQVASVTSHDPYDHPSNSSANTGVSRGILITPRSNATNPTNATPATPAMDPLQNHNPGITPDLIDPLREMRQRAPHRVYEHVLYRPGSYLHPPSSSSSSSAMDPMFANASAPSLPLMINPPSSNPQYSQNFTTSDPLMNNNYGQNPTNLLHSRPVEGAALRLLHSQQPPPPMLPPQQQQQLQPSYNNNFHNNNYENIPYNNNNYQNSGYGSNNRAIIPPSSSNTTHDRERFLHDMKHLRQQMGAAGHSSGLRQ